MLSKLKLWYMERADGVNLVGRYEVENRQITATTGKCWVQCRCGNEFFDQCRRRRGENRRIDSVIIPVVWQFRGMARDS